MSTDTKEKPKKPQRRIAATEQKNLIKFGLAGVRATGMMSRSAKVKALGLKQNTYKKKEKWD